MTFHAPDTDPATRDGKGPEYEVLLVRDYEYPGYAVFCPSLGCASQGDTREEALEMIADAIAMYLDGFNGQVPPVFPDAMAQMVAEYEAGGCRTEKAKVMPADWDQIIAECDAAVINNPDDAKAYVERGGAYLNKREYDRAIGDYTIAIILNPDDAETYCRRGGAYLNKGEYDRAIADYDATLRRDPYDEIALVNLEAAYIGFWKRGGGV